MVMSNMFLSFDIGNFSFSVSVRRLLPGACDADIENRVTRFFKDANKRFHASDKRQHKKPRLSLNLDSDISD